jgi:hypothetical protein
MSYRESNGQQQLCSAHDLNKECDCRKSVIAKEAKKRVVGGAKTKNNVKNECVMLLH